MYNIYPRQKLVNTSDFYVKAMVPGFCRVHKNPAIQHKCATQPGCYEKQQLVP